MFSSNQITILIDFLKEILLGSMVTSVQALTNARFALSIKKMRPFQLFFNFTSPVRFHPISKPFKGNFNHPLKQKLEGAILESIEQLNEDRIVCFTFKKETTFHLICEFFSKHPNYYLTDGHHQIEFSLHGIKNKIYHPPPSPSNKKNHILPIDQLESYFEVIEFDQKKSEERAFLQKEIKKLEGRLLNIEQGLRESRLWEQRKHEGDLLKASYSSLKRGMSSITLFDWITEESIALPLSPHLNAAEQIARVYKKAKKLQAGLPYLQKQLERFQKEISDKQAQLQRLQEAATLQDLAEFSPPSSPKPSKKKTQKSPFFEYISEEGLQILAGKNARGNDALTFRIAKGNDWWLHVQDRPGSHVVILSKKGSDPAPATFEDALQIALYHSKANEAEVCLTQRKYITRLGKEPGKVQISKHQSRKVVLDLQKIGAIKARFKYT